MGLYGNKFNNKELFFRVTYNGIGIYEAYKQNVSFEDWKKFLNSKSANWLPKPEVYNNYNSLYSYFTKAGINLFMKNTYNTFKKVLDENNINIQEVFIDKKYIVYRDKYQIVSTIEF